MEANPYKANFITGHDMNTKISVSSFDIKNTYLQKLLAVPIDRDHVSNLCKKSHCKNNSHGKSLPMYTFKSIMKTNYESHLISQLDYFLLVWMNHNRTLKNQINNLHEKALRLVYNDFKPSFHQFLVKENSVTIH